MDKNIVELVAGDGIKLDSDIQNNTITMGTSEAWPTRDNPLPGERGGTGMNNLGQNIDALKSALVEAIKNIQGDTGNTIIGNELVINKKVYIESSGEWTAPKDGIYVIKAGGGGAGGVTMRTYDSPVSIDIGGLSGSLEKVIINLKKNEKLQIIIGAAGTNGVGSHGTIITYPAAGGSTKVSTANFSIIAMGGYCRKIRESTNLSTNFNSTVADYVDDPIQYNDYVVGRGSTDGNSTPTAGKVSIEWFE